MVFKFQSTRLGTKAEKIPIGSDFFLRPYFGVQGLAIEQKFNLNTHTFFVDLTTRLPAIDIIKSNNRNSLLGIGSRAGCQAHLSLCSGLELYGNIAGSIVWNRFKIKQSYLQTDEYSSDSSTVLVD